MLTYIVIAVVSFCLGAIAMNASIIKKMINDSLTGIDNKTFDIGRVGFVMGLLTFLGLEIYVVIWKSVVFDMQTFGIAFGAMLAALGGALAWKSKTEPGHSGEVQK